MMVTLGTWLAAGCVVAIALGWLVPRLRAVAIVAAALLVLLVGLVVWWALLFFQVVRLDALLNAVGVYRLDPPGLLLVLLLPPLVPAVAFGLFFGYRSGASRRPEGAHS
jgi:hypothetical protein